jgi:hypothetical protein
MGDAKLEELQSLKARLQALEEEITDEIQAKAWPPNKYYTAYYATMGFILGIFGAMSSLLFNVIGSTLAGKSPLELIRVYLTFPLGEKALQLTGEGSKIYAIEDGVIMAMGCCLYLLTGMVLGVPVYLALTRWTPQGPLWKRLVVAAVVSLVIWAGLFYGVLSWLQPALFKGNWITDNNVLPWWVAAATHIVFGWTIVLLYPLGQFTPYRRPIESGA